MILLIIYLGVCVATLLTFWLIYVSGSVQFKKRYPDVKVPKSHWSDKTLTVCKSIFISMIPLFNLIMLFFLVCKTEDLIESSIRKIHAKYSDAQL